MISRSRSLLAGALAPCYGRNRAWRIGRAALRAGDGRAGTRSRAPAPRGSGDRRSRSRLLPHGCAAPSQGTIRSIAVRGNQRLEPETIRAYANLAPGQTYTAETLDQALKDLYATQLFADVTITGAETGDLVITVRENPVINRIILEGNKRLKDDKILPEIKLAPRQIFTRSGLALGRRPDSRTLSPPGPFRGAGRPKIVQLDQNRVDVVFEIYEGDLAKVRAINIIGNKEFRRRAPAQGDVHAPGRRASWLPEVERHLRSRPARRRPAEAPRILLDPGLCRFPRRLRRSPNSRRTGETSSSPTSSRKARATNSARSKRKVRFATSPPRRSRRSSSSSPATGSTPRRSRTR